MDILNLKIKDIVYNIATKWGKIKGDISEQTDLQNALGGKQPIINSSSKLLSDLIDDTNQSNKFVTTEEKSAWDGKQNALVSGTNIKTINNNSILGEGNLEISGGGSGEIYSETETRIGTWIDGKPLYRKIYSGFTLPNNSSTVIDSSLNMNYIDKLISLYGSVLRSDGLCCPIMYVNRSNPNVCISPGIDSTNFSIGTGNTNPARTYSNGIAVVEYTKTTDVVNS